MGIISISSLRPPPPSRYEMSINTFQMMGYTLGFELWTWSGGVCPHTIRLFTAQDEAYEVDTENVTANRTRYIVRDFTREDCFKDRPYILEWPYMRFYAEVPLTSPAGYVLGSYCVVDDKPRDDFSEEDVQTLQEISDAIGNHLENKRIAHYHSRFERLVTGLTDFSKDQPDFDPRSPSGSLTESANSTVHEFISPTATADQNFSIDGSHIDGSESRTGLDSQSSSAFQADSKSPFFFADKPRGSTEPSSLESNLSLGQPSPGEERSLDSLNEALMLTTKIAPNNESLVSLSGVSTLDRIRAIFSRASVLLRDAMNLDGVMFLDGARSSSSLVPKKDHTWEPLPKLASQLDYLNSCPTPLISDKEPRPKNQCEVLGQAFKRQDSEVAAAESQVILDEELLDTLLKISPQGQVVNLDIGSESDDESSLGPAIDESQSRHRSNFNVARILKPLFPTAQSVVWLPLWDHQKSRWMAGMLSWSSNTHRGLGVEELHYFKVFAHSIISEVSRVNWTSTEKSKFDLLSSLSHELRSPLHGILASAELLYGTSIDSAQQEMIKMVETSGLTLLETTDHLLTYCKINNSRQAKRVKGNNQDNQLLVLETDFDLATLVEEVTNILYTGQKDPSLFARLAIVSPSTDTHSNAESACSPVKPSVVVRINQSHSWKIRSLPGAWRRIVMNILGNSLKWTAQGMIEVSLSMLRNPEVPGNPIAHISVIDTGRGIAPEFLKHDLFTPFSQEDRLVEGVGLGLSIVRQLVTSLNGHINVRSELGLGTQVDIYIPVHHLADDDLVQSSSNLAESSPPLQVCLVAFNGYPDIKETPTGLLTAESKRKLSIQGMLADVVMSKTGWTVSLAESIEKGQGDIAVLESSTLEEIATPDSLPSIISANRFQLLLILETKPSRFEKNLPNVIWVAPPFGPLKIQSAIEKASALRRSQADLNINPNTNQPTPLDPPHLHSMEQLSIHSEEAPPGEFEIKMPHFIDLPRISTAQKQCHILIVDDNEINLKIMATFMRKVGCTYDTASNGLIALEKYKECDRQYNYVLMDISMPVMDGLVSTRKIRQFEKANNYKPSCIMAVTGVASDAMHQQALAAGVDRYLVKPLSLRELKKIIT
ncbi:hypothetical protein N7481_002505 [Penicillium waksmanii]|uniref:uncharacterized protein n=1 Tax=Penicillium waksmanii TaxID=69791 RepID=UPI002548864E|nr:uncharacterized protein N7481_002505 [Penicillium waksmanii]KAJ5995528.1 hypothetical protein N7481_002505 [Penicillium waksmanii]